MSCYTKSGSHGYSWQVTDGLCCPGLSLQQDFQPAESIWAECQRGALSAALVIHLTFSWSTKLLKKERLFSWQQAVSFSWIWCCCEGMWKYVPTFLFTCTTATENGKCVLNYYEVNNKELMLIANCILHVISPHWYNQVGFIPQTPALACDRTNRSPANTRYCHGKCALLARAQGNECSVVSTALGEAKFWRLCSMKAKVK